MKIRTDFVTNSSSSSFVVTIILEDETGKKYLKNIPEFWLDPDGVVSANLNCHADQLVQANGLEELMDIITRSLRFDIGECQGTDEIREDFKQFSQDTLEETARGSPIQKITLIRKWSANGEGSSSFNPSYLCKFSKNIAILAHAICEKRGEEKETAKKQLLSLLNQCSGFYVGDAPYPYGDWPTGFLGVYPAPRIHYETAAKDIEAFARLILNNSKFFDKDFAREIVQIDLNSKKISAVSEYYPNGRKRDDLNNIPQDLIPMSTMKDAIIEKAVGFETELDGTAYQGKNIRISKLKPGDTVRLSANYNDPFYNPVAIEVLNLQGETLGYLSTRGGPPAKELALVVDSLEAHVVEIISVEKRSRGNSKFTMKVRLSKK